MAIFNVDTALQLEIGGTESNIFLYIPFPFLPFSIGVGEQFG